MVTIRTAPLYTLSTLVLIAAIAGAQGTSPAPACASSPAAAMTAFDTSKAASLVGTFDVVMIDTTSLRGRQHSGRLVLWLQDSMPKRRASTAPRVQQQFLVGIFEAALPDSGEMWSRMMSRERDEPGVFWSDGFIRLGNFGPKNGISLYVRSAATGELRGMWTSQAGTAVIVDFTGEREPDEAGYFCARRVK